MVLDPTAGGCGERAGFLFPHPCEGEGVARCDDCGKAVCVDHRHGADGRDLCTTCARKLPDAATRFGGHPLFLAAPWYVSGPSTGDPHDFTESDGASTLTEGDEAFENDLGAS
jgi:hypothetical protein